MKEVNDVSMLVQMVRVFKKELNRFIYFDYSLWYDADDRTKNLKYTISETRDTSKRIKT